MVITSATSTYIYTMLTVIVILVIGFLLMQIKFHRTDHFFVPKSGYVLHQTFFSPDHFSKQCLEQLCIRLTEHYHILTLFLHQCTFETSIPKNVIDDADVLYISFLFLQDSSVELQTKTKSYTVFVSAGDSLTVSRNYRLHFSANENPVTFYCASWKMHPFQRSYFLSKNECSYIMNKWK